MKILYDYQIFQIQKFGGISRGLAELITHLPKDIKFDIAVKAVSYTHLDVYKRQIRTKRFV